MAPYPHVVIIVPGILGSVLTKDGSQLWDFSVHALGGGLLSGSISNLALSEPGSLAEDLQDGVVATDVLANMEAVPGLWRVGGYTRLRGRMASMDGLTQGRNLFTLPFDWRRDIRVPAGLLARKSTEWLGQWREQTNNPNAKIVLIAHSLGGLVASYFLNCMQGWRDTHTVINIGVPFRGAGEPLRFLANGPTNPDIASRLWPAARQRLSEIHRAFGTMDSMYQLLPVYRFVDRDGSPAYIHDVDVPGIDRARVLQARALHDELNAACQNNREIEGYRDLKIRSVIGTRQPTFQSARVVEGILEMSHADIGGRDIGGDSSVPRVSATPIDGTEDNATFVANGHAALPADEAVFEQIQGILSGTQFDLSLYRDSGGEAKITLRLPEIAVTGAPIEISASVSSHLQFLVADIADQAGQTTRLRLFRNGSSYTNQTDLPAGLYWVSVTGAGAHAASNVLVVLQGEPA